VIEIVAAGSSDPPQDDVILPRFAAVVSGSLRLDAAEKLLEDSSFFS